MTDTTDWAHTAMFTASEVEAQTGVLASTLRQWERRYGFPRPVRNASGYRLYSPEDVSSIGRMQAHLKSGVPAGRAAELTLQGLPASPATHAASASGAVQGTLVSSLPDALLAALLAPDDRRAGDVLTQAHAMMPVEVVLTEVMSPALTELGRLWERGEITVADEHRATSFLRGRLAALMELAGGQEGFGPLVVAACAPGEHHELGLMMLTLALRRRGVRVAYLGANVPTGDLAVFARSHGARAVLLALNGDWALEATQAHRHDFRELGIPVFYGGALLNATPHLAAQMGGLYAGPDATHAADQISRVVFGEGSEEKEGPA